MGEYPQILSTTKLWDDAREAGIGAQAVWAGAQHTASGRTLSVHGYNFKQRDSNSC